MSDKHLDDAEWKKFSKGRGYKDAAFAKALGALAQAKSPDDGLAAADDLDKQADALRKANKADKELGRYLDDLDKDLQTRRKALESEARKQAQQADTEEEDSPVLLTSKMLPLLRQVPKGTVLQAVVAMAGKELAVLLTMRPVAPARRKLLAEYMGATGSVKYVAGECLWEQNAHTFVLATQAAGMAKRIKAALLKQVEQRFKVRVRGEDPNDVDDDGEPAEPGDGQASAPAPAPATDPAQVAYEAVLAKLQPRIDGALKAGAAESTKIRALLAFAAEKSEAGQAKAAVAALEQLAKLLGATGGAADAPAPAPAPTVPKGFVNQARTRIAWQQMRLKLKADLELLERTILAEYKNVENFAELQTSLRTFDTLMTGLDESLADTLDAALNAADMAERLRLHQEARVILARYIAFVGSSTLLRGLDGNPFVPLTTHQTLVRGLEVLDKSLA